MRRAAIFVLALAWAPAAAAAPPTLAVKAAPAAGTAPLAVTLTASGAAVAYHWDLGDGTAADGLTVQHTYGAGAWTATVTATAASGETAQAQVRIAAGAITLSAPHAAGYAKPVRFTGRVVPRGRVVIYRGSRPLGDARVRADGSYSLRTRLRAPGPYLARSTLAASAPRAILVRPRLEASLVGPAVVGGSLRLVVHLRPAGAGLLRVRIRNGTGQTVVTKRGGSVRVRLDTRRVGRIQLAVSTDPAVGFVGSSRTLRATIVRPLLTPGATGPSVAELASRLAQLHYVSPGGASFSWALLDGVYAFQKVQGLPRTGTVDARTWAALAHPRIPQPRYRSPADHLEVDKPHQVLYVVRGGRIALIVPVSTAGLAGYYTPAGRFSIYRKVTGYDPSPLGTLYDPMYFTGGYAIHGNPSVPPYPASHGCIRVPMWIAPRLYASNPYGETVYVY